MTEDHRYKMTARVAKPMMVGVKVPAMDEFTITSSPDWWADAPKGVFSPQTLLVAASASCFILSLFKAANAFHVDFQNAVVEAEGIMREKEDGIWDFGQMILRATVHISKSESRERIERAANLAHKSCPIANTIKCPTELALTIVEV